MGKSPEELRQDIEQTRRELTQDVDALTDKVSPTRVVERRVEKARDVVTGMKESVFGAPGSKGGESVTGTAQDKALAAKDSAGSLASSVGDTVAGAPATVKQKAQGNPLAAGLIAFGVGWLVSSLLPASEAEQRVAAKAKDAAQPLVEQAGQVAQEIAGNLKEPAQDAVAQLRQSATDAASTVADEGKAATGAVADDAKGSAATLKDAHTGS